MMKICRIIFFQNEKLYVENLHISVFLTQGKKKLLKNGISQNDVFESVSFINLYQTRVDVFQLISYIDIFVFYKFKHALLSLTSLVCLYRRLG